MCSSEEILLLKGPASETGSGSSCSSLITLGSTMEPSTVGRGVLHIGHFGPVSITLEIPEKC